MRFLWEVNKKYFNENRFTKKLIVMNFILIDWNVMWLLHQKKKWYSLSVTIKIDCDFFLFYIISNYLKDFYNKLFFIMIEDIEVDLNKVKDKKLKSTL